MTFVEAAKRLQERGGHILRRASWRDEGIVIRPRNIPPKVQDWTVVDIDGGLVRDRYLESSMYFMFSIDDFSADDWEVGTVGAITWEGGKK